MDEHYLAKIDAIAENVAATRADTQNLKEYLKAVSENVRDVRKDLQEHKESPEAHGRGAVGAVVGWLGLIVAAGVAVREFVKR